MKVRGPEQSKVDAVATVARYPIWRKWAALFGIYFQDGLAYRASGIIWILTDVTQAVTMPLVMAAAAKGGPIAGYSPSQFVLYYLSTLLLSGFITSHFMWDLAMEVKEGQFSTQLLRPVSFFQTCFLRNLAWRVIRPALFLPFFLVLLWAYQGYLGQASYYLGWETFAAVVLGHLVSFSVMMALSCIALWTQEAMTIFELYYIPLLFLSGQIFPVSLLPPWATNLAHWMPFYYTTGVPTEVLLGRLSGSAAHQVMWIQCLWIVGLLLVAAVGWRRGLLHYAGTGM